MLFNLFSKLCFEFGVPILAWIHFGWNIGLAVCLWYLLWTMTGYSIAEDAMKRLREQFQNDNEKKYNNR